MTDARPQSALPAPHPPVNPETQPFWDATAAGRLLLRRCLDCGAVNWYPRVLCPACASMRTDWFESVGRGRVYSYTVNHRAEGEYRSAGKLVLAYVDLAEGPRLMTNIVEASDDELAVGLAVEVVFHDTGHGAALHRFRPVRGPQ